MPYPLEVEFALFLKSFGAVVDRHGLTLKEIKLERMFNILDVSFTLSGYSLYFILHFRTH
jgi:hypothetical protein